MGRTRKSVYGEDLIWWQLIRITVAAGSEPRRDGYYVVQSEYKRKLGRAGLVLYPKAYSIKG